MPVEHHRKSTSRDANLGEPVLDVVVVQRPPFDICTVTSGSPEAALIVGMRCDPRARELFADVLVAARVLSDAVNEE
jgi:hypothetical protein